MTIYGNTNKYTSVIYHLELREFNSDVCFGIRVTTCGNRDKEVSQDIVKVEIQNKEVEQCQGQDPGQGSFSNTKSWPRSKFLNTMSRPRSRTVFNIHVVAQLVFQ